MLQSRTEVRVRKGMQRDAASLAAVFRESWLTAYRGIIPQLHLESMIRRRDKAWWQNAMRGSDGVLVLEVSGKIAGYATFGRARGRGKYQGEIYEIYLLPSYQGLGLGEHLFEGARHALDERRLSGLIVWALAQNEIAADFYWRRGGRPIGKTVEKFGTTMLEKIGYGWA
ncbi:MAG: GNAT family N-acetyltransferase [Proteobacteria bacterium]|nr:GNAT family N-acetyltransferase [Pseudomonadota bacterium]